MVISDASQDRGVDLIFTWVAWVAAACQAIGNRRNRRGQLRGVAWTWLFTGRTQESIRSLYGTGANCSVTVL